MKYLSVTILLLVFVPFRSSVGGDIQEKEAERAPASSGTEELRVVSRYGDKTTNFEIKKHAGQYRVQMRQNGKSLGQANLTEEDYKFILSEFEKLPVAKIIPDSCRRSRVDIAVTLASTEKKTKASCIGVKTITEPSYRRFLNTMFLATY